MKRQVRLEEISDGKLYDRNDMVRAGCGGCRGCSSCCRGMGNTVVLDPMDIYRLTVGLGLTFERLLEDKIELNVVDGIILPNLKMSAGTEACGFLDGQGRCSIHAQRPGICRLFPLGRYYYESSPPIGGISSGMPHAPEELSRVVERCDAAHAGYYESSPPIGGISSGMPHAPEELSCVVERCDAAHAGYYEKEAAPAGAPEPDGSFANPSDKGAPLPASSGRLSREQRTFRYFLQIHECPAPNKTKVRVGKWLDTPELARYEQFICQWHYFLEDTQDRISGASDETVKNASLFILKLFYILPYHRDKDFYRQFEERLAQAKEVLAIPG